MIDHDPIGAASTSSTATEAKGSGGNKKRSRRRRPPGGPNHRIFVVDDATTFEESYSSSAHGSSGVGMPETAGASLSSFSRASASVQSASSLSAASFDAAAQMRNVVSNGRHPAGGSDAALETPPPPPISTLRDGAEGASAAAAPRFESSSGNGNGIHGRDDAANHRPQHLSSRSFSAALDTLADMAADLLALGDNHNTDYNAAAAKGAASDAGFVPGSAQPRMSRPQSDPADLDDAGRATGAACVVLGRERRRNNKSSALDREEEDCGRLAGGRPFESVARFTAAGAAAQCVTLASDPRSRSCQPSQQEEGYRRGRYPGRQERSWGAEAFSTPSPPPRRDVLVPSDLLASGESPAIGGSAFVDVSRRKGADRTAGAGADAVRGRVRPQEEQEVQNEDSGEDEERLTPLARLRRRAQDFPSSVSTAPLGVAAPAAGSAAATATEPSPNLPQTVASDTHRERTAQQTQVEQEQEADRTAGESIGGISACHSKGSSSTGTSNRSSLFRSLAEGAGTVVSGSSLAAVRKPADMLKGMMSKPCRVDVAGETDDGRGLDDSYDIKRAPKSAFIIEQCRTGRRNSDDEFSPTEDEYSYGEESAGSFLENVKSFSTDWDDSSTEFPKEERGRSRPRYDGTVYTNAATQRRRERQRQEMKKAPVQERAEEANRGEDGEDSSSSGEFETRRSAAITPDQINGAEAQGTALYSTSNNSHEKEEFKQMTSPLVDIKKFVRDITIEGIHLIWHRVKGAEMLILPTPILAFVQLEDADVDSGMAYSEPCLIWSVSEEDDPPPQEEEQEQVRGCIGLFDIVSVEEVHPSDPASGHFAASGGGGFFVTLNSGGVILFEARNGEEQRRMINGLRHMIARLAFNVVIGNAEICSELLDVGEGEEGELDAAEIAQAMNDVTNHLVDKAVMGAQRR